MHSKLGSFDHRTGTSSFDASDWPAWLWLKASALRAGERWTAWQHEPQRFAAPRLQVWSGLLGATAVLALLLAFHQVVQGGVRQGEFRRQAAAVLADATWRCKALRGAELARDCLADLDGQASPKAQPVLERGGAVRPAVLLRMASLSDGAGTRLAPQSIPRDARPASPRGLPEKTE